MGKGDFSKITRNIIAHEKGTPGPGGNRGDQLIKESIHDPYKTRKNYRNPPSARCVGLSLKEADGTGLNSLPTPIKNYALPVSGCRSGFQQVF